MGQRGKQGIRPGIKPSTSNNSIIVTAIAIIITTFILVVSTCVKKSDIFIERQTHVELRWKDSQRHQRGTFSRLKAMPMRPPMMIKCQSTTSRDLAYLAVLVRRSCM